MKKTDIAMIIFIATISVLASFFITRSILGDPNTETVTVKTIEAIDIEIVEPDKSIFNSDAINPAVKVELNSDASE